MGKQAEAMYVHSKDYWKDTLGIKNKNYEDRKNAMLQHLREKWPSKWQIDRNKKGDCLQVKEWIRPFVRPIISRSDLRERPIEAWVDLYSQWALTINAQSREAKRTVQPIQSSETTVCEPGSQQDPYQLRSLQQSSPSTEQSQSILPLDKNDKPNDPSSSNPQTPSTISSTASNIDWELIEVAVDASCLNLGCVIFPMLDLKPGAPEIPSHWHEFKIDKLVTAFAENIEKQSDAGDYEFVYNDGSTCGDLVFSRDGAYRVAIKRFVALGKSRGHVFHLRVQKKASHDGIKQRQGGTVVTYGKEIRPERSARVIQTGYAGDDEPEDSEDEDYQQPTKRQRRC